MIRLSDREGSWQSERWLPGQDLNTRHASGAGGWPPALRLWFPTHHIVTFTVIVCIGLLRPPPSRLRIRGPKSSRLL